MTKGCRALAYLWESSSQLEFLQLVNEPEETVLRLPVVYELGLPGSVLLHLVRQQVRRLCNVSYFTGWANTQIIVNWKTTLSDPTLLFIDNMFKKMKVQWYSKI